MGQRIEFYAFNGEMWCKDGVTPDYIVDESRKELIEYVRNIIERDYPEAYNALRATYRRSSPNIHFYHYRIVMRFLRCNFSPLDATTYDIDNGRMNFEKIECPFSKDCKDCGVICMPKFCSSLTAHENKIARMWYDGKGKQEIADAMFISFDTVNNHIRNIYYKLGVHEKAEFVRYANENKLFANEA